MGIGQANFFHALGWAVLNSLWQMAFLWVAYQVITGVAKPKSGQKSFLSALFLFTGFAWFIYTFFSLLGTHTERSILATGFTSVNGNEQLNDWLQMTLPLASIIYLALLVLPLLRFFRNYRYVRVIRTYGLSKVHVDWKLFVQKFSMLMGIRKRVSIWVSDIVTSPVTIGFLKPVILVPVAAINHLSPQQLEAVLLHELAHIRRYDYLLNLLVNFVQSILYFNPFTRAFVRIIEKEREKSCDEMVMQFQYDSHEYATALLILERNNHIPGAFALAASGKKHDLLDRIENIVGIRKKPIVTFNKLAGLFAGLLCIIFLNAVLIMAKPSSGEGGAPFSHLSSSFYFFAGEMESLEEKEISPEVRGLPAVIVTTGIKQKTPVTLSPPKIVNGAPLPASILPPGFTFVNYYPVETPDLKEYQVARVKEAIEASKKVISASQWKSLEKNIADVLTEKEKEELRREYERSLAKLDWKEWENKLSQSYESVDWDRVNEQLRQAVTEIRLDSLQHVYSKAINKLHLVQAELSQQELKGIPDTDITLREVESRKAEAQKNLDHLKSLRSKKIIRL